MDNGANSKKKTGNKLEEDIKNDMVRTENKEVAHKYGKKVTGKALRDNDEVVTAKEIDANKEEGKEFSANKEEDKEKTQEATLQEEIVVVQVV